MYNISPIKIPDRVATASIKKPIHNVKERPDASYPLKRAKLVSSFLDYDAAVLVAAARNIAAQPLLVEPIGIEPMTSSLQS